MERIVSFDDFRKKASEIAEDDHMEGGDEKQHYMFFANLTSIKHYIDEILKMDPKEVDNHLRNGHDWAADHIATSKDDIQEVADWIRNEMEGHSKEEPGEEMGMIEPENVEVEVEDDDDKVEVEDDEKEEGDEDEDEE